MTGENGQTMLIDVINISAAWSVPISQWGDWLTSGAVSTETLRLRTYHLHRFALDHRDAAPFDLAVDDLAKWLAAHQWSAETLRSYRSSLRSFYGWAHATGEATADPSRLLRKIKPSRPVPRPAPEGVIDTALDDADARGWLILMLGSRHGLRRGEISRGHSDDLIPESGGTWSLLVHGKGGKQRIVPLLDEVAEAIRALPTGWFFPNGRGFHITPAHVGVLARRMMQRAASTHQLRHRFATVTYTKTKDIRAVQELLGHASVATTQTYTAVDTGTLRAVMQTAA